VQNIDSSSFLTIKWCCKKWSDNQPGIVAFWGVAERSRSPRRSSMSPLTGTLPRGSGFEMGAETESPPRRSSMFWLCTTQNIPHIADGTGNAQQPTYCVLRGEGIVWLVGAVVCTMGPTVRYYGGIHGRIIPAAPLLKGKSASETVKCCWSWVRLMESPTFTFTFIIATHCYLELVNKIMMDFSVFRIMVMCDGSGMWPILCLKKRN